jgi:ABC-type phosphate transport system permease subunit
MRTWLKQLVVWLTRIGGVVLGLLGVGFFVSAWRDRSLGLAAVGIAVIAIGVVLLSIRIDSDGRPEYRLLRRKP